MTVRTAVIEAEPGGHVSHQPKRFDEALRLPAGRPSRVIVQLVRPLVDDGRFAAKGSLGGSLVIEADIFADGHERLAASAWIRSPESEEWHEITLEPLGNDRWAGRHVPSALGLHHVIIAGWIDPFGNWRHKYAAEFDADRDTRVTESDGVELLVDLAARAHHAGHDDDHDLLASASTRLEHGDGLSVLGNDAVASAARRHADPSNLTQTAPAPVWVDRELGRFSAWYEFFPRSTWNDADPASMPRLAELADRLDYVADLGFDIVYLPPIHPIGVSNRKGRNNRPVAEVDDKGSPWAIGSAAGGHTAVEPELGTIEDVRTLVGQCRDRGLELALDIAFQCSPDHPWIVEHPTWFRHRSDGSIQHAENPPKRYEDIVPLDFDTEDWVALWNELRDVFRFWIDHGVRVFRVDNPHTKAFAFWEWCIATTRAEHPDVIFLAEAFTRPSVMMRLAKAGFTQSYTYFTWRSTTADLEAYVAETMTEHADYFRPNFWPNTPDIVTAELQHGGRSKHASRAILAATLAASWGMYGPSFELFDSVPVRDGSEEYLDSEKYQRRHWDVRRSDSLAPLIRRLNEIRRATPALQHNEGLSFHRSEDPAILCFSKPDPDGPGGVVVVVNVDPDQTRSTIVDIDWAALGLAYEQQYTLVDLLGGGEFVWHGARNFVELEGQGLNAHIFAVTGPEVRS